MTIDDMPVKTLPDDHVLVVGGGPVGLVLALVLARHGIPSVLLERSTSVTRSVPYTSLFGKASMADKSQIAFQRWILPSRDLWRSYVSLVSRTLCGLEVWLFLM